MRRLVARKTRDRTRELGTWSQPDLQMGGVGGLETEFNHEANVLINHIYITKHNKNPGH